MKNKKITYIILILFLGILHLYLGIKNIFTEEKANNYELFFFETNKTIYVFIKIVLGVIFLVGSLRGIKLMR